MTGNDVDPDFDPVSEGLYFRPTGTLGATRKTRTNQPFTCETCGTTHGTFTMSYFDQRMICNDCDDIERAHPLYSRAVAVENAAVARGDYNFPGIGRPAELD